VISSIAFGLSVCLSLDCFAISASMNLSLLLTAVAVVIVVVVTTPDGGTPISFVCVCEFDLWI
jgi:hypothetical protein